MAELPFDVVEQILIRLDVEDLIQCKSVCKSWKSFISGPRFVKAHLNHAYMNDRKNCKLGHRRICLSVVNYEDGWFACDGLNIVGSCNGLVCVSPIGVELVVTNPLTREHLKLPAPPFRPHMHKIDTIKEVLCWGFGYDSSTDDYKVIAGFKKNLDSKRTHFYVLTLKSNTWKVIGQINYTIYVGNSGVFCGGALHWFMTNEGNNKVIISLDLSTEEFKTIPLPDVVYDRHLYEHTLGVIKGCLCIYSTFNPLSTKKWVLKNKWELYINDHRRSKYDVAHCLTDAYRELDQQKRSRDVYIVDKGKRVRTNGAYIRSSIFVKSLVSPRPNFNDDDNLYE